VIFDMCGWRVAFDDPLHNAHGAEQGVRGRDVG
jgi:hypothetical protein